MNDSPHVRLVRRPSDFQRRSTTHLLQIGTTTTCCTCCLVWVGSAVGGSLAWVHGWRALGESSKSVHWRRILAVYILLGCAAMTFYIFAALKPINFGPRPLQALLGGLIMVSPLNFLVIGAAGLLTAVWSTRHSEPEERAAVRQGACRLLWRSVNFANVGWILCLGVMYAFDPQTFSPLVCFMVALAATILIPLGGLLAPRLFAAKKPIQ